MRRLSALTVERARPALPVQPLHRNHASIAVFPYASNMRMSKRLKITFLTTICALAFLTWAVPTLRHARVIAASNSCICNLRQIDGAKQQWALDYHKSTNDVPAWTNVVGRYLLNLPTSPQGGTYTIARIDDKPDCSTPGHGLPHDLP